MLGYVYIWKYFVCSMLFKKEERPHHWISILLYSTTSTEHLTNNHISIIFKREACFCYILFSSFKLILWNKNLNLLDWVSDDFLAYCYLGFPNSFWLAWLICLFCLNTGTWTMHVYLLEQYKPFIFKWVTFLNIK